MVFFRKIFFAFIVCIGKKHYLCRMKRYLFVFAILATLCAPVSAQVNWWRALSSLVKAGQAATLSDEDLAELVKEEVAYLDKQYKVLPSGNAYVKRLNRVVSGITEVEGLKLNFKVYKTTEANAFACPDGSVRVFTGLMDILTDNELLGVIGHEIGHVALKHTKKSWRGALMRSAASDALGAVSDTWAAVSDSFLGSVSSAVLSASHSKYHEAQADDYGYEFLKKKNKNPWAMVYLFEKLKKLSKQGNSKVEKFLYAFSSHPDYDERINRMKAKAEADGYKAPK